MTWHSRKLWAPDIHLRHDSRDSKVNNSGNHDWLFSTKWLQSQQDFCLSRLALPASPEMVNFAWDGKPLLWGGTIIHGHAPDDMLLWHPLMVLFASKRFPCHGGKAAGACPWLMYAVQWALSRFRGAICWTDRSGQWDTLIQDRDQNRIASLQRFRYGGLWTICDALLHKYINPHTKRQQPKVEGIRGLRFMYNP